MYHVFASSFIIFTPTAGFPSTFYCGRREGYNVLVMELLSVSLQEVFQFCRRQFSLRTVLLLADQLVKTLH